MDTLANLMGDEPPLYAEIRVRLSLYPRLRGRIADSRTMITHTPRGGTHIAGMRWRT